MDRERSRMLIAAGYLVGSVAGVLSLFDLLLKLLPFRFGDTSWRIGSVGLVTLSVPALLISLLVICVTAVLLDHRRTLRAFSILSIGAATVMIAVLPLFVLDFLELRRLVRPEALGTFDLTMVRAAAAVLLTSGVLGWIGVGAWKATGSRKKVRGKAPKEAGVLMHA